MEYNKEVLYYTIVDGLAYTKEGILIYNLLAKTSSSNIIGDMILHYFKQYGTVSNLRLLSEYKFCIEFAYPKDAAKVLQMSEHTISKYKLNVEPCSSWHQPNIEAFIKYVTGQYNTAALNEDVESNGGSLSKSDDNTLIFSLNDHCLEEVFKKLSIKEQINFALTCQRFCNIFKTITRLKYSNLDLGVFHTLSSFQIQIFGLIVGPYIKVLKWNSNTSSLAKHFVDTYCKNVETLKIYSVELKIYSLSFYNEIMPKIKILELINVGLKDQFIKSLKLFKNLKYLNIAFNRITGIDISSLVHLKGLSLNKCMPVNSKHFEDICKNLKNLQYLDIRCCPQLNTRDFEHILENLLQLQSLKFTNTEKNFNCLARLPKLKQLEINTYLNTNFNEEFLKELAQHQANQLEELKFEEIFALDLPKISIIAEMKNIQVFYCCHNFLINDKCLEQLSKLSELKEVNFNSCSAISDEGILKMLKACLKLKMLNLTNCEHVTPDLIRNAMKILQEQHNNWSRGDRVNIIVNDELSFRTIIEELGLQNATTQVLKITLESNQESSHINRTPFPEGIGNFEDKDNEGDSSDCNYELGNLDFRYEPINDEEDLWDPFDYDPFYERDTCRSFCGFRRNYYE